MLFKQLRKAFIVVCHILLFACEEGGDNPSSNLTDVVSKDQLIQLAGQINFDVTMADGQTVTFSPSQQYSQMESANYSDMGNSEYVYETSTQVTVDLTSDNGSGFLELSNPENGLTLLANFEFVYCTTYRQLRLDHPQLNIDSDIDKYELIVAFTGPDDSILDLFEGEIFSEQYLYVSYDPYDQGTVGFFHEKGLRRNDFHGYTRKEGIKIIGEGKLFNSVVDYKFEFECAN